MSENKVYMVYLGERDGEFSVNSRTQPGTKYRAQKHVPFRIDPSDLWIASMPGYRVLSLIDFVPTTQRLSIPDESYLNRWEAAFLEGLTSSLPDPARVIELGTGKGISLARMLVALSLHKDAKAWSIDLTICKDAKEHMQECQIPNWRYKLIIKDSVQMGKEWEGDALDLIYMDGSHAYEGVLADVKVWTPHLKTNGVVAFHDYGNRKHRVTKAVNECMVKDKWARIGRVGSLIAFEKIDG